VNPRIFNIALVLALISYSGPVFASDPMGGLGEALGLINVIGFLIVFLIVALIIIAPVTAIAIVYVFFRLLRDEDGFSRREGTGSRNSTTRGKEPEKMMTEPGVTKRPRL
jgi:hypothetical protein